jgi:Na+/H+ antiporter NhaD/arsenite permease-like protein
MTILMIALFLAGYAAIVAEHALRLSKSASALLTGVACWTVYVVANDPAAVDARLEPRLAEIAGIVFFLLGAMTIVELIDAHGGFDLITARIRTRQRRTLLLVVVGLAFCLSAVLDNLITAIVMMSLVRRLVAADEDRMWYGGAVIVATNAGGAWSPIGDVTTTMLWIGGQVTSGHIVATVLVPSLVSAVASVAWVAVRMTGRMPPAPPDESRDDSPGTRRDRIIVLIAGVGVLLFVPVFKAVTHLPPFMAILLGLGVLWAVTERMQVRRGTGSGEALTVAGALRRIDVSSILFFLGILLAIGALASTGILSALAALLDRWLGDRDLVILAIGLVSALIDNVPLVGAAQGMYPLAAFPTDDRLWSFLAYCAGTGGSVLIIGSAAGIAVMGLQRIRFGWYVRTFSLPVLLGYAIGALVYLALNR